MREDPALAQLAAAAVSGLAPAGPELRRRPVEVAFDGRPGLVISAPLSVREAGFSLHAATRAGAADEQGRDALLKYILRPLHKRTFGIDVETCPRCGGCMRLLAVITDLASVARFLCHRGEPTEPPTCAPARGPAYWQSKVVRRHGNPSSPRSWEGAGPR